VKGERESRQEREGEGGERKRKYFSFFTNIKHYVFLCEME
jgi:hypothetical protein